MVVYEDVTQQTWALGYTQCHLISVFQALFCLTSYLLLSYLLLSYLLLSYKKGTTSELMMPFYDLKI